MYAMSRVSFDVTFATVLSSFAEVRVAQCPQYERRARKEVASMVKRGETPSAALKALRNKGDKIRKKARKLARKKAEAAAAEAAADASGSEQASPSYDPFAPYT